MNPAQVVFDMPELRKAILYYLEHDKYMKKIRGFVDELLVQNWFKYCTCEECTICARNYIMDM